MAIDRKIQKVFGGALSPSGNIAVYGSKKAGSATYSDNVETIQSNSWLNGIMGATSTDKAPYVQDLNALFYVITKQLAYLFQSGIPEWDSQTEYFGTKSLVTYSGKIYVAVSDSTNKNPLSEPTYWLEYTDLFTKYIMPSYDANVAASIGGYPQGAILDYTGSYGDTYKIKSLVNNNTTAPSSENIKKPSSDPAGTYYWEVVSNEFSQMFLLNPNSTQKYARLVADGNGYLGIENVAGIALNNLGSLQIDGSGNLNLNFTTVKVNNNPLIRLPNYASKTQVASSTSNTESTWTATADGWVEFVTIPGLLIQSNDAAWIKINGNNIYNQQSNYLPRAISGGNAITTSATIFGIYPIKSGDVIKVRRGFTAYFYPYL